MQSPTIVFDHVNKNVIVLAGGPAAEKQLSELAAAQQGQLVTAGQPKQP